MGSCTRKGRREISPLREGKKHFTDVTSDIFKHKAEFAGQPGKGPSEQRTESVGKS